MSPDFHNVSPSFKNVPQEFLCLKTTCGQGGEIYQTKLLRSNLALVIIFSSFILSMQSQRVLLTTTAFLHHHDELWTINHSQSGQYLCLVNDKMGCCQH